MKRFGLIGHPLSHSLSPLIHERILEIAGIKGSYTLFDTPPKDLAKTLPVLLRDLNGFNCTIPHKTSLLPHLKSLDSSARLCGAVNTVYKGCGYNTDTAGFLSSGIRLAGKDVLLLGTGGTAHMMASACMEAGARSLEIRARNTVQAAELSAHLAAAFPDHATRVTLNPQEGEATPFQVVLNATPVGMWPHASGIPCGTELLRPGVSVFDPIYNPTPTRLVLNARKHGASACGGLRMLLRQAVTAQRICNPDVSFDETAIERAVLPELFRELLRSHPVKILITGFMGSGKSTVAGLLAKRLGIGFIDLDNEITAFAGCPIADIFRVSGESYFRLLETAMAESRLSHGGSAVVAAGGGLPVSAENRKMIRTTNTLVLNIGISFDEAWRRIEADPTRPLASDRLRAEALYQSRADVYEDFCDCSFNTQNKPEDVAAKIERTLTDIGRLS